MMVGNKQSIRRNHLACTTTAKQHNSIKRGFRRLVNIWLLFHMLVGVALAFLIQVDLATAANAVLLPLVGILIGLCFAWAGNAQALLQTRELNRMTEHSEGGFTEYVYIDLSLISWTLS